MQVHSLCRWGVNNLLTLSAHAREGYSSHFVCLSVTLSVCHFLILKKAPFSGLKLTPVHSSLFYKLKYPLTIRSYLRKSIILLKIICLAISIDHNEGYYKSLEQNISVLICLWKCISEFIVHL